MTYGDGVCDINIRDLLCFHKKHGKQATLTSVRQPGRFGVFSLHSDETQISYFKEKPQGSSDGSAWINGGYFVLEPSVLDLIDDDSTVFEKKPLEVLAETGNLYAYKHDGFWQPMDTLRDKNVLEELWAKDQAPWKVW
jgi:glucose-1-phosphate cytidylyltransferase